MLTEKSPIVRASFQLPLTLMDEFRDGCEKRGINMSALQRKDIEGHVQRFRQEDVKGADDAREGA